MDVIRITLRSDLCAGNGESRGNAVDIDIVLDILSIPACRGMKVKIVSWDHFNFDFEMSVFYRRMILKYSVKHTDVVITLTKENEEAYRRQLGRTENITTIYNPMEKIKEIPDDSGREKYVITAGRLVEVYRPRAQAGRRKSCIPKPRP